MTESLPTSFYIIYFLFIILMIVSQWKIFVKAGEPGWACIVPFYNLYIYLKIVGKPAWWLILMLIPLVNLIVLIILQHNLSKSFGKDIGFTLGLIFLGFIFYPVLAFSDATYVGPNGVNANPEIHDNLVA
jgi:hypothetical protein